MINTTEHIVTIIGFISSIITIVAFIFQLRKHHESIKIYLMLFIVVILSGISAYSLSKSISLEHQNAAWMQGVNTTQNVLYIINDIMQNIEIFNNLQTLPNGREEEYIYEFEKNIENAAKKLRDLEVDIKKQMIQNG